MDYAQPPEAIITDLINNSNGTTFVSSHLAFGSPFLPSEDDGAPRNTLLSVTAADGSPFTGTVVLEYNRLPFSYLVDGHAAAFFRGDAERVSDLLPQINARYGVQIGIADIIDAPLAEPNEDETPVAFTLVASPSALVWQGEQTFMLLDGEVPDHARVSSNGFYRLTLDARFRTTPVPA